jgi:outer membrane protein assembly factor BamE (lipoprotein component of BamABCDE complex)
VSIRRNPARLALLLVCAPFLTQGCVLSQTTDGTQLIDEEVAKIVVGKSTRADVARILGAPDSILYSNLEHDPLFERAFRYHRTKRKTTYFSLILFSASRAETNSDNVMVFFDERGVVDDIGVRLDMDEPRYGTPWSDD